MKYLTITFDSRLSCLRKIPVEIGTFHRWQNGSPYYTVLVFPPIEQSICRKECHLSVIAKQRFPTTVKFKLGDAFVAISGKNGTPAHKLHWIAQCITHCACHQAATDTIFHSFFIKDSSIYNTFNILSDKCFLFLCIRCDPMCCFWHFRKPTAKPFHGIFKSRFFHAFRQKTLHNSPCSSHSTPTMDVHKAVISFRQIFDFVNQPIYIINTFRDITIMNWESCVCGTFWKQMRVWVVLYIFAFMKSAHHNSRISQSATNT